ncbi:MAG: hypothetical protein ACI83O_000494 [Patescibacteria group bacterium]|jgi:hypothetical protein
MPIGPQTLLDKLTQEDEALVFRVENELDKKLQESYNGGNFEYSINGSIRVVAQKKIQSDYEQAGWGKVTYTHTHDQRDGDYTRIKLHQERASANDWYGK